MKSTTSIQTDQAKRIAKRLLNHWKHKFKVAEEEQKLSIFMPDANILLTSYKNALDIRIDTQRDDYAALETVVIEHVNRMAHQEFKVNWQHHT